MRYRDIDLDLLLRHDRRGPRYTSYPTAPQFRSPFGGEQLQALSEAGQTEARGLSIYVHSP